MKILLSIALAFAVIIPANSRPSAKKASQKAEITNATTNSETTQLIKSNKFTYEQIKNSCNLVELNSAKTELTVKLGNEDKKLSADEVYYALNMNILKFYNLNSVYNSELKTRAFLQTDKYQTLYSELKEVKDAILNSYFYLPVQMNGLKYKLGKKAFEINNDARISAYGRFYNYIKFNQLCLGAPYSFKYRESRYYGNAENFYDQYFQIPVNSELAALKIEESSENKNTFVVFVFKIHSSAKVQSPKAEDLYIKAKTVNVFVYDQSDNTIASSAYAQPTSVVYKRKAITTKSKTTAPAPKTTQSNTVKK